MKYVCLGYHDEQAWNALPAQRRQTLIDQSLEYERFLRENGHVVDARALAGAQTAATLRFDGGSVTVTDGPFAETKEQLGGFMVLEAMDLNHAISLMKKLPCMCVGGSLEIRPLNEAVANSQT